jgi:hypothetical protein
MSMIDSTNLQEKYATAQRNDILQGLNICSNQVSKK